LSKGISRSGSVKTNEKNYLKVRSILVTLKEEFGLPVDSHAEDCAQAVPNSSSILAIGDFKVFNNFEFIIPCWQIGVTDYRKVQELASEVSKHFQSFGLEASVMLGKEADLEEGIERKATPIPAIAD
jgi:hypothetical protein